jgi:tagatose-1,6-bisphosphate aldolase
MRCATPEGHFVILAIDHRANLLDKLNQYATQPLDDQAFSDFKQAVIHPLAGLASAVLTDPDYGIGPGIAARVIPGQIGLLAPLEVTNYDLDPSQRQIEFIPGWSVAKIKALGGDGVKLLLPYHPDAENAAEKLRIVQQIVGECRTHELPFFLEPIPYPIDPAAPLSNEALLQISVEMCQRFSAMDVDVLKLSFPVDPRQSSDESEWRRACEKLSAACSVPWALLSAGVDYTIFLKQARIACEAGASGVIVGRALWGEAVALQGAARTQFLGSQAVERMQELAQVCGTSARPWFECVPAPSGGPHWYESLTDGANAKTS